MTDRSGWRRWFLPETPDVVGLLVAQGEGLATGPMGGFDEERIKEAFRLPEDWAVAAVCALGYPDAEFDRTLRKPLGDIVHWDQPGGQRVTQQQG